MPVKLEWVLFRLLHNKGADVSRHCCGEHCKRLEVLAKYARSLLPLESFVHSLSTQLYDFQVEVRVVMDVITQAIRVIW